MIPVEIKSSMTVASDFFDGLTYWNKLSNQSPSLSYVVYAGNEPQKRSNGNVVGWRDIAQILS